MQTTDVLVTEQFSVSPVSSAVILDFVPVSSVSSVVVFALDAVATSPASPAPAPESRAPPPPPDPFPAC